MNSDTRDIDMRHSANSMPMITAQIVEPFQRMAASPGSATPEPCAPSGPTKPINCWVLGANHVSNNSGTTTPSATAASAGALNTNQCGSNAASEAGAAVPYLP